MAITPSQWSYVLTIPESYTPSAATSGQTLVITESVIAKLSAADQLTFWTNVQNGGGDVRICTDSAGTNQLPVEIVSLDNVAQTCVIWTRKPTYSGAGDLYLFIGKAGETQPAVTGPFGRNAVWSDFEYCFHFDASGKLVDSAGNHTLIESGDVISVAGKIGQGADAQLNSANFYEIDGYLGVSGGAARTHSMWFKSTSGTTGLLEYGTNITRGRYTVLLDNGRFRTEIAGSFTRTNDTTLADGAWHKAVTKESGTGQFPSGNTIVVDGTPQATSDGGEGVIDTAPQSNVHFEINKSLTRANSQFDEYSLRLFETTDATDATEYNNQNDPASFFGTPTLATTGGGGGAVTVDGSTTLPSLTATGNASATLPQPSLSASINLTQLSATGSASATLPNPQLDAAITFNAFTATGNASVTLPQPDASGSITFNAPTATGSASATLPQPTLQAAITLPVVTANGDASATLPGFNLSASVNIPTLTATGAAQATLPQPVVSASVTMPSLTALGAAEATEPSFTVSGSVTLQPPTVTGSASATLPQPSISGNIVLPSIQASGFIIGGEIVITVELETNINEPQLSVNINEPQLSTNIDGPKLSTNITE